MKTQLDLSDIVTSPEFRQTIEIIRDQGGEWFKGKYTRTSTTIYTTGVVSATNDREIDMIPEGDRGSETKDVHTIIPLYTARGGSIGREADIIVWNGEHYKVVKVQNSGDYGYWKATISKIDTADAIQNPDGSWESGYKNDQV